MQACLLGRNYYLKRSLPVLAKAIGTPYWQMLLAIATPKCPK